MPENNDNATRQAPAPSTPNDRLHVTLPPFWPDRPSSWFKLVDGQFTAHGITSDWKKYFCVVMSLDSQYSKEVDDIIDKPPENDKFETLKRELIMRLSTSQEKKTKQLLEFEEIGDRKPSQFLRHLRSLAGSAVPEDLLRTIWMGRLPVKTQTLLATVRGQSLEVASDLADSIHEMEGNGNSMACNAVAKSSNSNNSSIFNMDAISQQICALEKRFEERFNRMEKRQDGTDGGSFRSRRRSRSRSRVREKNPDYCFYHNCFGQKARKCRSPCSYQKN